MKKLYRSNKDRMWAGLLGGLGEYFDSDPTLLRLAYLFITIFTGFFPGLIFYILAAIIVPKNPGAESTAENADGGKVRDAEFTEEKKTEATAD